MRLSKDVLVFFSASNGSLSSSSLAIRLTPDGTLEWIFAADISLKTAGNSCRPLDLVVVPDGSAVWITGYNNYNVLKLGSYTFNRAGSRDLLLVKLNAATGAVEYAAQSLSGDPTGYSIKADTQGNVYVTGDWSKFCRCETVSARAPMEF